MTEQEERDNLDAKTPGGRHPAGDIKSNGGEEVEESFLSDGEDVARSPDSKANWKEKTIWTGDNLPIMRGMNSESVDLIYLDPPFNSKRNYAAPIGSEAAGAEFKDTWTLNDIDEEWINLIFGKHPKLYRVLLATMTDSDKSYLVYMAVRLLEMKRILKPTGSIYLHCDPTMSHYLKLVMDAIFGRDNFRNEVVWCYSGPRNSPKDFPKQHDLIFRYVKGDEWTFNGDAVRIPHKRQTVSGGRGMASGDRTLQEVQELEAEQIKKGKPCSSWWSDIGSGSHIPKGELTGFKTQKPLKLLDRIIQASSNPGDIVFDPFCGCATTLASADALKRDWIGIDVSPQATYLVKKRIKEAQGLFLKIVSRDDISQRTDLGKLPPPKTHKRTLFGEQEGKCNGCGHLFNIENFDIDHIIAKSNGGTDHIDNLQLLCGHCNSTKGDRGMEYLIRRLKLDHKALGIQRME